MSGLTDILKSVAPTVATALLGPMGGAAVTALGEIFGLSEPTQEKIAKVFTDGQLTGEHLAEIRKLELQYQNDEKERGFRYSELAFKDRDSARTANVSGGTQRHVFYLSLFLLTACIGSEIWVLFRGYPVEISDIVVGRILGVLDSVAMVVLTYWYGTTDQSRQKTALLADAAAGQR